jgi:hypothetical protein
MRCRIADARFLFVNRSRPSLRRRRSKRHHRPLRRLAWRQGTPGPVLPWAPSQAMSR